MVALLGIGSAAGAELQVSIPCDVTALNYAIVAANNNTGPHTIRLAPGCVYNVQTPASAGGLGANALPRITGTVTLLGRHTTIRRDPDATDGFRIAEINGPNGRLTVEGVTATGGGYLEYANQATAFGGGIFTAGISPSIKNSRIGANRAFDQGGGIYNDRAPMDVSSTTIADNRAGLMGGGIANYGSSTLTKSTVRRNSALNGGGIWQAPSPSVLTLVNSRITNNTPNNCRPVGSVPGCTS
ncbi:hypothetical protein OG592_14025 [Streptomyces avidinii]|uniref:hypothetical protein n=1 Tax=Streptomyces avidinii TaxID=1895 RepID=UPI00386B7AD5|nr:hypothetical protein OG592_14025 [Streptomyces avidinii]